MTKKLTGTLPYQTPLNADLGTMAYQDADSVRVGSLISDGSVEIGINRTSSTSGIVLQLSDNVTGAQTDGVYKAIRSASNAGNSISEIRFLETDGTNNNTSISFATASTAGGLTERLRINQVGNVGIGNTNPQDRLHILDGDLGIEKTGGRRYRFIAEADGGFTIRDQTAAVGRIAIDSSGNVKFNNSNNIGSITAPLITLTGAGGSGTGGQTVNIITANGTARGLLIIGSTQNCSAIFFINFTGAVNLISQTTNETRYTATAGAANTANVYVSGSNIVLQNNIQAIRGFTVTFIGQVS